MQRSRMRFTIRRMLVVVATMGFVFGSCIILKRRSDEFRMKADRIRGMAWQWGCQIKSTSTTGHVRAVRRQEDYEWRSIEAYERAARYPWLPVVLPDQPPR